MTIFPAAHCDLLLPIALAYCLIRASDVPSASHRPAWPARRRASSIEASGEARNGGGRHFSKWSGSDAKAFVGLPKIGASYPPMPPLMGPGRVGLGSTAWFEYGTLIPEMGP